MARWWFHYLADYASHNAMRLARNDPIEGESNCFRNSISIRIGRMRLSVESQHKIKLYGFDSLAYFWRKVSRGGTGWYLLYMWSRWTDSLMASAKQNCRLRLIAEMAKYRSCDRNSIRSSLQRDKHNFDSKTKNSDSCFRFALFDLLCWKAGPQCISPHFKCHMRTNRAIESAFYIQ